MYLLKMSIVILNLVSFSFFINFANASPFPRPLPAPHPFHDRYNAELGRKDAKEMIKKNTLTILAPGMPSDCEYTIKKQIYKHEGINWTAIGDETSDEFESYRNKFNDVMVAGIADVRGRGYFIDLDKRIEKILKKSCKNKHVRNQ